MCPPCMIVLLIDPYCGRHVTHPLRLSPRHPLPLGRPMMRGVMRSLTSTLYARPYLGCIRSCILCTPIIRSCIAYNPLFYIINNHQSVQFTIGHLRLIFYCIIQVVLLFYQFMEKTPELRPPLYKGHYLIPQWWPL